LESLHCEKWESENHPIVRFRVIPPRNCCWLQKMATKSSSSRSKFDSSSSLGSNGYGSGSPTSPGNSMFAHILRWLLWHHKIKTIFYHIASSLKDCHQTILQNMHTLLSTTLNIMVWFKHAWAFVVMMMNWMMSYKHHKLRWCVVITRFNYCRSPALYGKTYSNSKLIFYHFVVNKQYYNVFHCVKVRETTLHCKSSKKEMNIYYCV